MPGVLAMTIRIIEGDVRERLAELPDQSVQMVCTSPPYYGLRDYNVAGQLGLEPTLAEYIATMVDVFRDVRRVLRDDGVLWLNLGDSYARTQDSNVPQTKNKPVAYPLHTKAGSSDGLVGRSERPGSRASSDGMKPKDLMMVPARLAIALQDDGWYLRSDVIWHKPNPMPESVTDRPTSSHEHIFLLTKRSRYYYDADAVKEAASGRSAGNATQIKGAGIDDPFFRTREGFLAVADKEWHERNCRNVWTIATKPFSEAHFATFPPEIPRRCIKAGSRPGDTVLDPFGGSGTVGLEADRLDRDAILIELNPEYAAMARRRITADAPLLVEIGA
jgi:DNA modification methylase